MSQENVHLTRRGFELWNAAIDVSDGARSDAALRAMIGMYHPDAELDYTRTLPDFPTTKGTEAILSWTADTRGVFASVHFEPLDFIDLDDSVLVPVRVDAQGASGALVSTEMAYVYRFQEGLVISATGFANLAEALEAVGLEQ
jgi:ketosteroid isomerase-like protein